MIIKFCFENEIHRCSDPPRDFSSLPSFLNSMFRLPMPGQIDLSYVNSQGQTIYLNTEEDYQDLMRNNPTKPVKVVITERKQPALEEERSPLNGEGSEYEVIPNYREEKMEENPRERDYNDIIEISGDNEQKEALIQEEREQSLQYEQNEERDSLDNVMEGLTQRIADNYIMPQVRSAPTMDATEIKNLVRDALKEEMPLIVAQVREALLRENQIRQQHNVNVPEQVQPRNNLPVSYQAYYSYPYYNYPINRLNSYPGQMPQPPIHMSQPHNSERRDRVVPEAQPQVNQGFRLAPPQANANEEKGPHLLDKVVTALSRPLNKATEMVDNLMQKFEGDPYVYCAEGKYPKSVVDKVAHMKEIFPDDDKKELLEFVQRFPRDAPLDQIVTVYWSKKGSQ